MDKLRGITYFVHAVRAGGFSAAAKALVVTPAAVSKAVGLLEQELGFELLHRTTRTLTLTAEGAEYYAYCRQLLNSLAEVESGLSGTHARPRGKLTIGMPPLVARYCIMPELATLLARYPELELRATTVFFSSEMLLEGLDVFFSVGPIDNPQLIARKLAQTHLLTCASAQYLALAGVPREPTDLSRHKCLTYLRVGRLLDHWRFRRDGEERMVLANSVVIGDDHDALIAAAAAGAGIVRVPDILIHPLLRSGQLIPLLTEWRAPESPSVYLVYRKSQRRNAKVQVFVDWAIGVFKGLCQEARR